MRRGVYWIFFLLGEAMSADHVVSYREVGRWGQVWAYAKYGEETVMGGGSCECGMRCAAKGWGGGVMHGN